MWWKVLPRAYMSFLSTLDYGDFKRGRRGRGKDKSSMGEGNSNQRKGVEVNFEQELNGGIGWVKTMKFIGRIKGQQVVIFLGNGVTHNFISWKMVKELNLPIMPMCFMITLGDEQRLKGLERSDRTEIECQGIKVAQNVFLFKLGNIDVILCVD